MTETQSAAEVVELGHVGLFVHDLDKQLAFYTNVVGLQVTDSVPDRGIYFLSSRPDVEHHELLLAAGRDVEGDVCLVQQVSWRVGSLPGLKALHQRITEADATIDMVVSHGYAFGVYFRDPEGNRLEVYWQTGLDARQPFLSGIDLTNSDEELLANVNRQVEEFGEVGFVDESMLVHHDIG